MAQAPVYPLFLHMGGRPALVVGGGRVGLRKARGLADCGARVTVVSITFELAWNAMEGAAGMRLIREAYAGEHMRGEKWQLAFAATDVAAVNAQVQADARTAGILCCRCDLPEEGDFSGGAVAHVGGEGQVTIAVSTGGASPALGARISQAAAEGVDPVLVTWAGLFSTWRAVVKGQVADEHARQALLKRLAGEEMEGVLRTRGAAEADHLFTTWLAAIRGQQAVGHAS